MDLMQGIESGELSAALKEIDSRFSFHPAKPEQIEKYEKIRKQLKKTALFLEETCPSSRELSSAITKLDEAMMHANASVARHT